MTISGIQDRAFIRLGEDEIRRCLSYTVETGVMVQPSRFTARIGFPGDTATILKRYPKGTKFELHIRDKETGTDRLQFVGEIDARHVGGAPASITFAGRDALAKLHDTTAVADKAYALSSYVDLVKAVLKDAGYAAPVVVDSTLDDSKSKTGATNAAAIFKGDAKRRETGFQTRTRKIIVTNPQVAVGQSYFSFLRRHLDRAGMFLYATADGSFVLMQPDPNLAPIYTIWNRGTPGDFSQAGNVVDFEYTDDGTNRCSDVVVFADAGGAQFGRTRPQGQVRDEEMHSLGIVKPRGFVDANVTSLDEATFFARRRLAETRRDGWRLIYHLAGHTTPSWNGGGRLTWCRNTAATVKDDELGPDEVDPETPHYIESVAFVGDERRTMTTVRLMRSGDLLFGED